MQRRTFRKEIEAAIGIGTLIVFIALVLVASIAAAVIIQTAGELENRAELTGSDAAKSATGGIAILNTVGHVDRTGTPLIDQLFLVVGLSAGSEGVDLWNTIVVYQDDTDYVVNITHSFNRIFATDRDRRILERGELYQLIIGDPAGGAPLNIGPGERFTIKIIPPHRVPATAESYIAPESLDMDYVYLV